MRRYLAVILSAAFLISAIYGPATSADFSTPSTLSAAGDDSRDQLVAASDDGSRLTAVWVQTVGADERVYAASATVFAGVASWGAPAPLSPAGVDAREPDLALSADGTVATVVWSQTSGVTRVIKARTASINSTSQSWSATQQPSTNALITDVARAPKVSMSADGQDAIVVWQRGDGAGPTKESVETSIATIVGSLATWKSPQILTNDNGVDPLIATSRDGSRPTVVWRELDTSTLFSRTGFVTPALILWGTTDKISVPGASHAALAITDDGLSAAALWRQQVGADSVITSNVSTVTGVQATWEGPFLVSEPNGNAGSPRIALSANGNRAVAMWQKVAGADTIVQASLGRIVSGQPTWGGRTDLSPLGRDGFSPDVTISSDGARVNAAWTVGSPNAIWASSANISGLLWTWETPKLLAPATSDASSPDLAASRDGDVLGVVWNAQVGGDSRIQAVAAAQPQTITFPQPGDLAVDTTAVLQVSSSSGLPITLTTSTASVCNLSGATLTAVAEGTCSITASAAGSLRFVPAPPVERTLTVAATPVPKAITTLTVKARKRTKKLRPRTFTTVVRSVQTNGKHSSAPQCLRKGKAAPKACRIRIKADGRVRIRPKCRRNLTARVTLTAQAEGAAPVTWKRRWRVRAKGC